jgi:hypothetical protein
MGEGNEVEFGAAVEGEQPLRDLIGPWREQMLAGGVQGHLRRPRDGAQPARREAFSSDLAEDFHRGLETSLRDGVDGWVDDDLAFVRPWGFGLDEVRVPVHLWQGGPGPHGAAGTRAVARRAPADVHAAPAAGRRAPDAAAAPPGGDPGRPRGRP